MKKDFLNEERLRFKQLNEYNFYMPENYGDMDSDDTLIIDEDDDLEQQNELPLGNDDDSQTNGPSDDSQIPNAEEPAEDEGEFNFDEPDADASAEEPAAEPLPEPAPAEDEVELDVSDLVQGTEEAKNSADKANQQLAMLINKFSELTAGLGKMDSISAKIENLEKEIERRNPTEVEKLEMRSLSSYPYNLKLTDFWEDKKGQYDVMDKASDNEYTLTQDMVDGEYNPNEIKDSFDFEEEEI